MTVPDFRAQIVAAKMTGTMEVLVSIGVQTARTGDYEPRFVFPEPVRGDVVYTNDAWTLVLKVVRSGAVIGSMQVSHVAVLLRDQWYALELNKPATIDTALYLQLAIEIPLDLPAEFFE